MNDSSSSARAPLRRGSIARRLRWSFAATGTALLGLAMLFLYILLSVQLHEEDRRFMIGTAETVRYVLVTHGEASPALEVEVGAEAIAHPGSRYFVRVLDSAGREVIETPGMRDKDLLTGRFPPPVDGAEQLSRQADRMVAGSTVYRLGSVAVGHPDRESSYVVQIALDMRATERLLRYMGLGMVVILVGGAALLAWLAGRIASRGLMPLDDVTWAAQQVQADALGQKIGDRGWPSEVQALAAAFDQMLVRLAEAFERLERFSADMAHELRTPLNNMMGSIEVALTRERDAEFYQELLVSNLEELQRLNRVISALLFLARSRAGTQALQLRALDIGDLAAGVQAFVQPLADERDVSIAVQGKAKVLADAELLQQALANLLLNAVRHSPDGGRIQVNIETREARILICVSDQGPGVSAADRPHIFDRFYQSKDSPQQVDGSGLGLALVKAIAELHGGRAMLMEAETGACFCLELPPGGPVCPVD